MQLFDKQKTGEINFKEFQRLWRYLGDWQRIFLQFDADKSGSISESELKLALNAFGFNLSDRVMGAIILKYSKPGNLIILLLNIDKFLNLLFNSIHRLLIFISILIIAF